MTDAATVTFFADRYAQTKREEVLDLDALAARIHAASAPEKSELPWLKLARFGDVRSEHNSLRHDANVLSVCGVEGDYDGGKVPFDAGVQCLRDANVEGIVYTSPSYSQEFPKWRAICWFSQELPPAERTRMMGRLAGIFAAIGVEFAGESWTLSQSYFYGSVDNNPAHQVERIRGTPIDLRDDLEAVAIAKPERVRPSNGAGATASATRPEDITDERIRGLATKLLDHLRGAEDGQKHHTLLRIARTFGGYLHLMPWSENEAVAQLLGALPGSVEDWDAARRTAQDGLRRGIAEPLELKDRPRRKPTHIWQSKDYDFDCIPTGREWPSDDGRIYAEVMSTDGTLSYVPKDELHRKTKNKPSVGDPPGGPPPIPPPGPPPGLPPPGPASDGEDDDADFEQRLQEVKAESAAKLAELNNRYAVVNEAGKVFVFQWRLDPVLGREVLDRIAFDDFKRMFLNRSIEIVNKKGEIESRNLAEWWLRHPRRRQFLGGVTFDPTDRAPPDYMNLWRGFAVEPKPGDWSLMRDHILKVICAGDREHADYVLNWLARLFQHPEENGEIALVMRGPKGAGKSILGSYVARAFKNHGLQIMHASQLTGRFNDHLRDCCVIFADEAFVAGDRMHEGVLKGLITERMFPIEGKYKAVVTTKNMLHIIMASNHDWVVPASTDERRYAVFDVLDTRTGDRAYFRDLAHQMDHGGLAAMIWEMQHRDISNFEVRDVPQTAALAVQKTLSLPPLQQWWLEVLSRGYVLKSRFGTPVFGDWHKGVATQLLVDSHRQWCFENRKNDIANDVAIGRMFTEWYGPSRKIGKRGEKVPVREVQPVRMSEGDLLDNAAVVYQERPKGYEVGELDGADGARDTFVAKMPGINVPWRDNDDVDC